MWANLHWGNELVRRIQARNGNSPRRRKEGITPTVEEIENCCGWNWIRKDFRNTFRYNCLVFYSNVYKLENVSFVQFWKPLNEFLKCGLKHRISKCEISPPHVPIITKYINEYNTDPEWGQITMGKNQLRSFFGKNVYVDHVCREQPLLYRSLRMPSFDTSHRHFRTTLITHGKTVLISTCSFKRHIAIYIVFETG